MKKLSVLALVVFMFLIGYALGKGDNILNEFDGVRPRVPSNYSEKSVKIYENKFMDYIDKLNEYLNRTTYYFDTMKNNVDKASLEFEEVLKEYMEYNERKLIESRSLNIEI